jgi:MoaA/NifB/PqqE/SkfB family radical SAM enzyme
MKILEDKNEVIELRIKQLKIQENAEKIPMQALRSITINPTELCNRKCHFCPRSDPKVYPSQNLHISEETVRKLSAQLKLNNYSNRIGWSGNGEPLLTENFYDLVKIVSSENPQIRVHEINTNGDKIRKRSIIEKIYESGINHIIVSLYDGDKQLEKFTKMFEGYDSNTYTLRKSYYHSNNFSGFTNRAGAVDMNTDLLKSNIKNKCFLPFYKLFIDWNGDILVCCEDWFKLSKKLNNLNINTHALKEIWESDFLNGYRKKLSKGDRSNPVCNRCNVNGEKIGKEFVEYYDV